MSLHITRFRLSSAGPVPARFDPLDITLVDVAGTPADSVLYLPNTGGKTVMLRLLFSVLHPQLVDKIGSEEARAKSKNVTGYVLDGDTAHVVIEWRRARGGVFVDDDVLVTGLVMEWRARPSNNPADLLRHWYSIRGPRADVGIDRLVFETTVGSNGTQQIRRLKLSAFKEQLNELAKSKKTVEVTGMDVQRRWSEHLDGLGLDAALFRYQAQMNHNEAGASAIARFASDMDFVRFFLEVVTDPSEIEVLDKEVDEVATKAANYPVYARRLQFEEAVAAELSPLVELTEATKRARVELGEARSEALLALASFSAGATRAREQEDACRERAKQRDTDARNAKKAASDARDAAQEYKRISCEIALNEESKNADEAKKRVAEQELEVLSWDVAEEQLKLKSANAEVDALENAFREELARVEPLRLARDGAARDLKLRLLADVFHARESTKHQLALAEEKDIAAGKERKSIEKAKEERGRISERQRGIEEKLRLIDAARRALVERGLLSEHERATEARAREEAKATGARTRADELRKQIEALEQERGELDKDATTVAAKIEGVKIELERVTSALTEARGVRTALMADSLVQEVAETPSFDIELLGSAIVDGLLKRARSAEEQRVALELRTTDDRRALKGIDATGLLPPPVDVERALKRLHEEGIVGAVSGARYLSESVAAAEWRSVTARRPDLVGGIVLNDPSALPRARSVLEGAGLLPTMIITVGTADALITATTGGSDDLPFVIPPAEAIWDREQAIGERERRQARIDSHADGAAKCDDLSQRAREQANALSKHLTAWPPGRMATEAQREEALRADEEACNEERRRITERRAAIAEEKGRLANEEREKYREHSEATARARELLRLEQEEAGAPGLSRELSDLAAADIDCETEIARAEVAENGARTAAQTARDTARGLQSAVERLEAEVLLIKLSDDISVASAAEAERIRDVSDLEVLRASFRAYDEKLAGEVTHVQAKQRRDDAITTRDEMKTQLEARPREARIRAEELLLEPEAAHPPGRRSSRERAVSALALARDDHLRAFAAQQQAKAAFDDIDQEIRRSRRDAKEKIQERPTTRAEAQKLENEARMRADAEQARVGALEKMCEDAKTEANDAKALASTLGSIEGSLRLQLDVDDDATLPVAAAFSGDIAAAEAAGKTVLKRLRQAIETNKSAEAASREQDSRVRAVLSSETFVDLFAGNLLYLRLQRSSPELLARDSRDLSAQIETSIKVLKASLESMKNDVKLITTSLARAVNKAVTQLRAAESRSKMPESLRGWAGTPFLTVRFDRPPPGEVETRLATFAAELIGRTKDRPTGTTLILQALERAVGQFTVEILKPNEAFETTRVAIAEVSSQTFSNGQRSTVATALMLMLSELRRHSRAAAKGDSVGTLLLDNPFGNANAGFLVDVQRTVAAAAGIQLVYTTGIADVNTLRRFPNVVALSNDAARGTMRRFVHADERLLSRLIPSEAHAGGKISASRVQGKGTDG